MRMIFSKCKCQSGDLVSGCVYTDQVQQVGVCTLPNPLGSEFLEVNHFRLGNALQISVLNPWKKHLFEPIPVGKKYSLETGLSEYSLKKVARTSTGTGLPVGRALLAPVVARGTVSGQ